VIWVYVEALLSHIVYKVPLYSLNRPTNSLSPAHPFPLFLMSIS
jgi:hypothetical protein